MTNDLPEKFVRLMNECHGEKGESWLDELPEIIDELEQKWSLKVGKPFANLSYHFVAPCILETNEEAVIKIGFPEKDSPVFNEAEMLRLYNGNGAVRLLNLNENRFALLLERLKSGENLLNLFENKEIKAVETAIEVLQKIKRKPPEKHNFILLENWFAGFEKAKETSFPRESIDKAQKFYGEFSSQETFLIHGDFHHENVLSAQRESFLAIDPKGVIGQIGYEISVFLNNHVWWLARDKNLNEKLQKAVLKFSEAFEIEEIKLKKWAYAQAVLSAWWTFEENGENWETDLALADVWKIEN